MTDMPFSGAGTPRGPYLRRKAFCQVLVEFDGEMQDITSVLEPYLISVKIVDPIDLPTKCSIELDDRDARLGIPIDEARIQAYLGWSDTGPRVPPFDPNLPGSADELPFGGGGMTQVFDGLLEGIESGCSRRGGGRRLWIEATSDNIKGDGKSNMMKSWGDGSSPVAFGDVFKEIATAVGYNNIQMPENIAALTRNFWFVGRSESFHSWGDRISKEMGLNMKISGGSTVAVFSTLSGTNAMGDMMPHVVAEWGVNLIAWRVRPFVARPQYGTASSSHFSAMQGAWSSVSQVIGGNVPFGNATANTAPPNPAPNAAVGEQWNNGSHESSQVERGTGWVLINGEPEAKSGGRVQIIGARPGVDGSWRIEEAEHNYSRKGGYTTRCNLGMPELEPRAYDSWMQMGRLNVEGAKGQE